MDAVLYKYNRCVVRYRMKFQPLSLIREFYIKEGSACLMISSLGHMKKSFANTHLVEQVLKLHTPKRQMRQKRREHCSLLFFVEINILMQLAFRYDKPLTCINLVNILNIIRFSNSRNRNTVSLAYF